MKQVAVLTVLLMVMVYLRFLYTTTCSVMSVFRRVMLPGVPGGRTADECEPAGNRTTVAR
jgi:hypothetical protein